MADDSGEEMEAERQRKKVLAAVFGESSDSDEDRCNKIERGKPRVWESVEGVNGLWICPGFLDDQQQSSLICAIRREGWFTSSSYNQAMRFGDLPEWALQLSRYIRETVCYGEVLSNDDSIMDKVQAEEISAFPTELLWREPLFDQLIANTYLPGEGICAHVDLMRFDDGIAIVSLESECVMHFTRTPQEENTNKHIAVHEQLSSIPVLLNPGSLVLMSGEARYLWKHEINRKPGFQIWNGEEVQQLQRTSVTLRKLCIPSGNC